MSESMTNHIAAPLSLISDTLSTLGLRSEVLHYGLSFKTTKATLPGLMNKIRKKQGEMDLDISCMLYDAKSNLVDTVWFKELRDSTETIRHQGDSLNGTDRGKQAEYEGSVDPEQIIIRLASVPSHVAHIALVLSSYYGQPIRSTEAGHLHLSDDEGNVAFNVDLTTLPPNCNAVWIAHLRREIDDWHLTVQNLPTDSNNIPKMAKFISHELSRSLPVEVNLVKSAIN